MLRGNFGLEIPGAERKDSAADDRSRRCSCPCSSPFGRGGGALELRPRSLAHGTVAGASPGLLWRRQTRWRRCIGNCCDEVHCAAGSTLCGQDAIAGTRNASLRRCGKNPRTGPRKTGTTSRNRAVPCSAGNPPSPFGAGRRAQPRTVSRRPPRHARLTGWSDEPTLEVVKSVYEEFDA